MVPFGDLSALAVLLRQLEGGLEEVHEQARSAIQSGDVRRGLNTVDFGQFKNRDFGESVA